jgi:PAS domain S-box-containing protein
VRSLGARVQPWLPPIRRREFWWVQALVLAIAGAHAVLEALRPAVEPPALYLVPTSLYFVPVVYAALNFGVRGSLATAAWSAALTLPNTVLLHTGLEQLGEAWQMSIVLAVAIFVGQRVDRESRARREAEERELERRRSEARYRGLFDNAAEAILLLDGTGDIVEANAAAASLLGRPPDALHGATLASIIGDRTAGQLLQATRGTVIAIQRPASGRTRWVEPVANEQGRDGSIQVQLMLHDVTAQHERQRDLEAYARRTLAAREEEQRRIGRELHDGPVQSLVLLWRKLDTVDLDSGPAAATTLAEVRGLAESTADELRRISRALRPSVLDDLGLAAALKSEATALARRTGIGVRFAEAGDESRLPSEIELALLRVAQEALHNVERHADAARVSVRLAWERDRIHLVVRDDGRGFDALPSASDLLDAGKLGLVGMQERVRLVGGTAAVRTRPGEGTTVDVIVPRSGRDEGASI